MQSPYCPRTHGPIICLNRLSQELPKLPFVSITAADPSKNYSPRSLLGTLMRHCQEGDTSAPSSSVTMYRVWGRGDLRQPRLGVARDLCKSWLGTLTRDGIDQRGVEELLSGLDRESTAWCEAKPVSCNSPAQLETALAAIDRLGALHDQYRRVVQELASPQGKLIHRFVALDIEAFERAPRRLTEFGIAIYDRDTRHTQHHHLLIREHLRHCNTQFAPNRKRHFAFGKSLVMSTAQAMGFLTSLLLPRHPSEGRVALVGHALSCDLAFLRRAKVRHSRDRIKAAILDGVPHYDLQGLHRHWECNWKASSLEAVCSSLEIPTKALHNAGNDAAYTLEAFRKLTKIV